MNLILSEPVKGLMLAEGDTKSTELSYHEILELIQNSKQRGFDIRSIVTLRHQEKWRDVDQDNWGVISGVSYNSGDKVFKCKFVGKEGTSEHKVDELVLIHKSMDWKEINDHVEKLNQ